ncbi:MAG: DUF2141 domain-containing protein [Myxococcales bacterium]|nr:DUF2141 domain-containing protein [Myxococcales bacterium]
MRSIWIAHGICALLAALMVALAARVASGDEVGGTVDVTVTGFKSDEGQLGCLLFKDAQGFPMSTGDAARKVSAPIAGKAAQCVFEGVPAGTYAVAVVHDANRDGEVDTNFLGIPKEGVAASNNALPHTFGPPTFDEAKFRFDGTRAEMTLRLIY